MSAVRNGWPMAASRCPAAADEMPTAAGSLSDRTVQWETKAATPSALETKNAAAVPPRRPTRPIGRGRGEVNFSSAMQC